MATVIHGDFEWDDAKAEQNLRDHGVSFEEAVTAFEDERHLLTDDGTDRGNFLLIGFSLAGQMLTVVHVERGERDRIISAWPASRHEQTLYQGQHRP